MTETDRRERLFNTALELHKDMGLALRMAANAEMWLSGEVESRQIVDPPARRMNIHNEQAKQIVTAVCNAANLTWAEFESDCRGHEIARPRQLAMLLISKTGATPSQIALQFAMDRTSILHGITAAKKRLETDTDFADLSRRTVAALYPRTEQTKDCLGCKEPFESEGAGNRQCKRCASRQDSPFDDPAVVRLGP